MRSKADTAAPRMKLGLALLIAIVAFCGAPRAHAQTATTTTTTTVKKVRRHRARVAPEPVVTAPDSTAALGMNVDQLKGEVGNLRKRTAENVTEIKKIETAITVAPPAAAAQPQTVGEHVAVLEKDLGDVRKNLSDNLGIHVHGLVDAGYNYNGNNPQFAPDTKGGFQPTAPGAGSINQYREFDQDANSFTLTQGNIHIDRTGDGGVGFVLDLNFGKTGEVLRASTRYSNSETSAVQGGGGSFDQVDPTQFYLTYTVPIGKGINLQAGKFVTLLGAEVIPTYNNINYNESRGLLFTLGLPLTHTGIRAQYSFTDKLGLTLGINNGWDNVSDGNTGKTVEGEVTYTATDSLSFVLNGIYGAEQINVGASKRGVIDPIVTWKTPLKGVQLIGEYIYGHESGPTTPAPGGPLVVSQGNSLCALNFIAGLPCFRSGGTDWQSFAGYFVWDINDQFELATRGEVFRDSDGIRTGLRQTLGEVTQTLTYRVPKVTGLVARLEYRHDESSAAPFYSNKGLVDIVPNALFQSSVVPLHTYSGQDTIETAAIYTF